MKKLIFLGGSNAFNEIMAIINEINKKSMKYEVLGILDDNTSLHGTHIEGIPVLGSLLDANKYSEVSFVFAIGSYKTRLIRPKIISKLNISEDRFETIIHPDSNIYPGAKIGNGCVIHAGTTICADAIVSDFSIITYDSVIAPKVFIKKYAIVTTKTVILTGAKIGYCAFIGVSSVIGEGVEIGDASVVIMGSVVFRGKGSRAVLQGNPAKMLYRDNLPSEVEGEIHV